MPKSNDEPTWGARNIISDNSSNFVGADKELRELVDQLDRNKITRSTSHRGIQWHFNPPLAPHFGGMHETMIKAAKKVAEPLFFTVRP